jgi:hypothetical protein
MTTTLSTPSPSATQGATARRGAIWKAGATAAVLGAIAAEAVGGIARAVGVPMEAGGFGASHADSIGVGSFATATILNLVIGTLMAAALVRWARRPERTFVRSAVVLTALSLVPVVLAPYTAGSTKVTLAITHLVVAAIAIPVLARATRVQSRG